MKRNALFIPLAALLGCAPATREAQISIDGDGNLSGTLPDGTTVLNQEEYEAGIAGQVGPIEEMHPLALSVVSVGDGGAKGIAFSRFRISIQSDASYLEGCIRKKFLHLKIVVDGQDFPASLIELHLIGWFDGGKPCVGIMNTGFLAYGWCYKACISNPKTGLRDGIKKGLVAAGVSGTTAAIMALLVAPIATAALAM
jgi:hypothetical protein